MLPIVLPLAIAGATFLLALLFRVDAIFLFLSLAVGSILVGVVGDDASSVLDGFVNNQPTAVIANLIVLLLPVVLTIFLLKKSMPSSKLPLQIVPLAATSATLSILVINQLSSQLQRDIYATTVGEVIQSSQDAIVAGTAGVVLLLAWLTYRHKKPHGKHHK